MAYVTRDQLMAYLDVGGDNPARVDVNLLDSAIGAAEGMVGRYTGRLFAPNPAVGTDPPVTKTFSVRGSGPIRIPDLRSATLVTIDGTTLTLNQDYDFEYGITEEPYTSMRLIGWTPYSSPYAMTTTSSLVITGHWGWDPVPDDIKHATLVIAAREYRKRDAMFADIVDTGTGAFEFRAG